MPDAGREDTVVSSRAQTGLVGLAGRSHGVADDSRGASLEFDSIVSVTTSVSNMSVGGGWGGVAVDKAQPGSDDFLSLGACRGIYIYIYLSKFTCA